MSGKIADSVFLIGFAGSGKTTVGKALAAACGMRFFDTDALIARREGKPVHTVLEEDGEDYFRTVEAGVIADLVTGYPKRKVVALGGGGFERFDTRNCVCEAGIVVYLSCAVNEIYRRLADLDDRPLLRVKPKVHETVRQARLRRIRQLVTRRLPNYRKADIRYATTGKPIDRVVSDLMERITRHGQ